MEKLTYKQAYDLIIEAYFKDEIRILSTEFCFCGTLSPSFAWSWQATSRLGEYPYTISEYAKMEKALFSKIPEVKWLSPGNTDGASGIEEINNYEEKLFAGMSAALDVLKEIHRQRGENVDELPALTKRVLSTQGEVEI